MTHAGGAFYKSVEVTSGILQALILGFLLFLIYLNDLTMFADDAQVLREVRNKEDCNLQKGLREDLEL